MPLCPSCHRVIRISLAEKMGFLAAHSLDTSLKCRAIFSLERHGQICRRDTMLVRPSDRSLFLTTDFHARFLDWYCLRIAGLELRHRCRDPSQLQGKVTLAKEKARSGSGLVNGPSSPRREPGVLGDILGSGTGRIESPREQQRRAMRASGMPGCRS